MTEICEFRFHAVRQPWNNDISLYVACRENVKSSKLSVVTGLQLAPAKDGEVSSVPIFRLDPKDAQALMDELYQAGVRPSEGIGAPGQFEAMKAHLSDLRRLVFKDIKAEEDKTWG